jgi:hypothetical protein
VLLPRPWVLRQGATKLFMFVWFVLWLPVILSVGGSHGDAMGLAVVVALAGLAAVYIFQARVKTKLQQDLSSAPLDELLLRPGAARIDLSKLRSVKTNALRMLVVREDHEDLNFSILFSRDAVDAAVSAAYPSVFVRDG